MDNESVGSPTAQESAAAARWRTAEGHLYPLIVSDPDLYELVVKLVVEARDILRAECPTIPALVGSDAVSVLDRCPTRPVVESAGFDPGTAFDAARAQRFREISAMG